MPEMNVTPQAPLMTARLLSHIEKNDSFASSRALPSAWVDIFPIVELFIPISANFFPDFGHFCRDSILVIFIPCQFVSQLFFGNFLADFWSFLPDSGLFSRFLPFLSRLWRFHFFILAKLGSKWLKRRKMPVILTKTAKIGTNMAKNRDKNSQNREETTKIVLFLSKIGHSYLGII